MDKRKLSQADAQAFHAATKKLLDGLDTLREAMRSVIDRDEHFDDSSAVVPLLDTVCLVLHAWDEVNAAGKGLPVALWHEWRDAR